MNIATEPSVNHRSRGSTRENPSSIQPVSRQNPPGQPADHPDQRLSMSGPSSFIPSGLVYEAATRIPLIMERRL